MLAILINPYKESLKFIWISKKAKKSQAQITRALQSDSHVYVTGRHQTMFVIMSDDSLMNKGVLGVSLKSIKERPVPPCGGNIVLMGRNRSNGEKTGINLSKCIPLLRDLYLRVIYLATEESEWEWQERLRILNYWASKKG